MVSRVQWLAPKTDTYKEHCNTKTHNPYIPNNSCPLEEIPKSESGTEPRIFCSIGRTNVHLYTKINIVTSINKIIDPIDDITFHEV